MSTILDIPTTSPSLGNALTTALVTSLFSAPLPATSDRPSPRAAYQDSLYGRAVVIDVRPTPARRQDGAPVGARHIEATGAGLHEIRRIAETSSVMLLSGDGEYAARIAAHLQASGLPWVEAVDGGFAAWRAAGLPVRQP